MAEDKGRLELLSSRLRSAVRTAGACALDYFRKPVKSWTKTGGSPVTEADLASDQLLRDFLCEDEVFGWISEETGTHQPSSDHQETWIVDPIDGTRAFIAGREDWTVCAALLRAGHPVIAAIYQPITDDLFEAIAGHGAWCNGEVIHVSGLDMISECSMVGYDMVFRSKKWGRPWPKMRQISPISSMALRLAAIANGQHDAVVTVNAKSDWDLAAGDLLVQEAGGKTTDLFGNRFTYGFGDMRKPHIAAAGVVLHGKLVEYTQHWQQRGGADG